MNAIRYLHARWIPAAVLSLILVGSACADELELLFQLLPDERPYIGTAHNERGVAYNPVNGHVLIVSRTGGVGVYVLDGDTGAELHQMNADPSVVGGGFFPLSLIGVTDDGVVYAGDLSIDTTSPRFKLYRWENDSPDAVPTVAFEGDPAGTDPVSGASLNVQRWGDSFDVRGSGTNTQVIIGSRQGTVVAVLTTTDGVNFTSTLINTPAAAGGHLGIAFGSGNTYWGKVSNNPLRHIEFNLGTGAGTLLQTFGPPAIPNTLSPIGVHAAGNLLAGIALETPDNLRIYDISDVSNAPLLIAQTNCFPDNANANGVGAVDFGTNRVYALDTNNGLVGYRIVPSTVTEPPTINTEPLNQTVLEGAYRVAFNVGVSGTPPLRFQWRFNGTNIAGATNSTLTLTNVQSSQAGAYSVEISNAGGSVTSADGVLTVLPVVQSSVMTPLWKLTADDPRWPFLNGSDSMHRGLTYNLATTNVIIVSRTAGLSVNVLNGLTGELKHRMSTDGISGGTFALSLIGAADDGAVYGANLVTDSAGAAFTIYKWDDDSSSSVPNVVFQGDPSGGAAEAINRRFGDTFDVRGSGTDTQILVGSRLGIIAVVFTTTDGFNFSPVVITTDAPAADFGLGIAFGAGNTFWGKASGASRSLRQISFDLASGQGTTLASFAPPAFPSGVTAIGVDPANNLVAAIGVENPDNLRLYDVTSLASDPVLLDQEFFPTDNENPNGTGSVAFGGGRVYALDTNNGVLAMAIDLDAEPEPPMLSIRREQSTVVISWTGSGALQSAATVTGPYANVPGATSPYSADTTAGAQQFFRVQR